MTKQLVLQSALAMHKILSLFLICTALIACTAPAPSSRIPASAVSPARPTDAATLAPTAIAPITEPSAVPSATPVPPSPTAAPSPTAPQPTAVQVLGRLFDDPGLGISFTYPGDWETLPRAPDAPPGVSLHGPAVGEGPEPVIFAITVDVQQVIEKSAKEIVDLQMQQVPEQLRAGIKREAVDVDGETGEQVVGLPSSAGAIEAFVLHEGQLYLIILQPYDEANPSLTPYLRSVRAAYEGILQSWKFTK